MKLVVYQFRQCPADAIHAAQILDSRSSYTLQAAKVGQQIAPPGRTNARHILKRRPPSRLGALCPVPHYGKTMGFITNFLNQMQGRMVRRQF